MTYTDAGPYTIEIDQTAGALNASIFRAQRTFLMLMTAFALLAYGAIQATFWFMVRRLVTRHERLLYLYNRGDEIRSSLDLHEVVTHLSRDATRLARGDYGIIALFDESSSDLVLQATFDSETGTNRAPPAAGRGVVSTPLRRDQHHRRHHAAGERIPPSLRRGAGRAHDREGLDSLRADLTPRAGGRRRGGIAHVAPARWLFGD